jgi:molecular chaperone DnaK (HSP70)
LCLAVLFDGRNFLSKLLDRLIQNTFQLILSIPPAPRGVPQIEVSFDLDANSILSVSAQDKNNASNTKSIRIEQQKGRLSTEEIDRIVKEAEKFKAEDAAKRERVDAKNQLESVLYQSIQQLGEKVPSIKEYCQTQLDWLEDNQEASTETLQGKMKEVLDFLHLSLKSFCRSLLVVF